MPNRFKTALSTGKPLAGLWSAFASPTVAEVLAFSSADWVLIDMEHGPSDVAQVMVQLQAMAAAPAAALVRVSSDDSVLIKRVLDVGAETILVPFIDTAEQAADVVAATRYPPLGRRGMATMTRAGRFGRNPNYLKEAADMVCTIVQIETPTAVENAAAIAAVPGIDAIFVGPSDLAASMGYPGNSGHADVEAAVNAALAAAKAAGKPVGTFAKSADDARRRFDQGFQFVTVAADVRLLVQSAEEALRVARG